jgi:hypothetical protein
MSLYGPDFAMECNMTPNNVLDVNFSDESGLEHEEICEGSVTNVGWKHAVVDDVYTRGYLGEIQNFLEHIALDTPLDSDFVLACETLAIIYIAYYSASTGKTINIKDLAKLTDIFG